MDLKDFLGYQEDQVMISKVSFDAEIDKQCLIWANFRGKVLKKMENDRSSLSFLKLTYSLVSFNKSNPHFSIKFTYFFGFLVQLTSIKTCLSFQYLM